MTKILLVEDQEDIVAQISDTLDEGDYLLIKTSNYKEAISIFADTFPDIAILDYDSIGGKKCV